MDMYTYVTGDHQGHLCWRQSKRMAKHMAIISSSNRPVPLLKRNRAVRQKCGFGAIGVGITVLGTALLKRRENGGERPG